MVLLLGRKQNHRWCEWAPTKFRSSKLSASPLFFRISSCLRKFMALGARRTEWAMVAPETNSTNSERGTVTLWELWEKLFIARKTWELTTDMNPLEAKMTSFVVSKLFTLAWIRRREAGRPEGDKDMKQRTWLGQRNNLRKKANLPLSSLEIICQFIQVQPQTAGYEGEATPPSFHVRHSNWPDMDSTIDTHDKKRFATRTVAAVSVQTGYNLRHPGSVWRMTQFFPTPGELGSVLNRETNKTKTERPSHSEHDRQPERATWRQNRETSLPAASRSP